MKVPYQPFYYWLFRQPFDFAAIAFGIAFSWMSCQAAAHCVSEFGYLLWAVGVGKSSFDGQFLDGWSSPQVWLYAGCYTGFALVLIWQGMKRRSKRFTAIYAAQVMVLVVVWIADQFALGLDERFLAIGRMANYRSLTVLRDRFVFMERNVSWLNVAGFWLSCVIIAMLFQFLFTRIGWWILQPSFRLRGSLFVRAWAYASLAAGPVFFVAYALTGCSYWIFTRSGTYEPLVFWFILCTAYSLLAPAFIAHRLVQRRAMRLWLSCKRCGYTLRGNVSGRCPECGTPCETPA